MLLRLRLPAMRPVGLMDKVSASGAGDSRLESWAGHFVKQRCAHAPPTKYAVRTAHQQMVSLPPPCDVYLADSVKR